MVSSVQRAGIESDFLRKQKTYFRVNYETSNVRNSIRRERRQFFREAASRANKSAVVIDVGCGPGLLYPEIYEECETYFAIDIVQSNLDEFSRANPRAVCLQMDLDTLAWDGELADLAICCGCIEYSQDGMSNLARLCRLLRVGGTLIISFPNAASPYRIWHERCYRPLVQFLDRSESRPTYARSLFRLRSVRDKLLDCGMEIVSEKWLGLCLLPRPLDTWLPYPAHWLRKSAERCVPFLRPLSTEFVVAARRSAR